MLQPEVSCHRRGWWKGHEGRCRQDASGSCLVAVGDNPDSELLFGIQYWNTGDPASGTPAGRSSTMMDVKPPDPLVTCCGWGFVGGTDKNNAYAGWYHAATTVRLAVKDKALMDQIIKAAQELVPWK